MSAELFMTGKRELDNVTLTNVGSFVPSTEVKAHIDQTWGAFTTRNPKTFNGPLVRLLGWTASGDRLSITTQSTDYASYIGTRDKKLRKDFTPDDCARPLGMTIVPVGADNKLVITRRSLQLEQNPGGLYFIGGYIESGVDAPGSTVTIWQDVVRELQEELNVGPEHIAEATFWGAAYDPKYYHPEVYVKLRLTIDAEDVIRGWPDATDNNEAERIIAIDKSELETRYNNNTLPYTLTWSFRTVMELGRLGLFAS